MYIKQSKYNPFIVADCDIIKLIEGQESKVDFSTIDNLTCYGVKLLLYIYQHLESDYIVLRWKDIQKELGYGTYATFHKGIAELEGVNLIRRKGRNEYWTNPLYLFKSKTDKILMSEYYLEIFQDGLKKFAPKEYFEKFKQIKEYKKELEIKELKEIKTNKK